MGIFNKKQAELAAELTPSIVTGFPVGDLKIGEYSDIVPKSAIDDAVEQAAVELGKAAPLVKQVLQNPVVPALLEEKNLAPVPHVRVGSIIFKNPAIMFI